MKLHLKHSIFLAILLALFVTTLPVHAQSDEDLDGNGIEDSIEDLIDDMESKNDDAGDNIIGDVPDDFTGTFSDEDPDSPAYKERQLFGDDEAGGDDEEPLGPTHLLTFDFEGQVTVTDMKTESAYLEILYNVKFEQEVEIGNKRFRTKGKADVITDIVGDLATNELFTCKLDIQMGDADVELMTRHVTKPETENEDAKSELAIQLTFNKENIREDWLSNCTGIDGSKFNTQGEQEKYLSIILEALQPTISGFSIDEYERSSPAAIQLLSDIIVLESEEEEFILQGSSQVTVDPLQ